MKHEPWLLLAIGVAGIAVGILVLVFSDTGSHSTALLVRCIMGFMVAVVWIMAIADEVVEVLTVGVFGSSSILSSHSLPRLLASSLGSLTPSLG